MLSFIHKPAPYILYDRSLKNSKAIVTIAEKELFLSQRSLSLRSLESGFSMISTFSAIVAIVIGNLAASKYHILHERAT